MPLRSRPTPQPATTRALIAWWLLLAGGCGAAGDAPEVCVAAASAPLFFAQPAAPSELALAPQAQWAIGALIDAEGVVVCSATLVAADRALTAAHCYADDLRFRASAPGAVPRRAMHFSWHAEHDVMLIELAPAVPDAVAVAPWPIAPAPIDASWLGADVVLAGAGLDETGAAGTLKFVRERIVRIDDRFVLVSGEGASGACYGDSGGPLIAADDGGRAAIIGVLSRGADGCLGLDAYVRIDAVRSWLVEQGMLPGACD